MDIKQKLIDLELHDKPIESISVSYKSKEVKIIVLSYNDEYAKYFSDELEFKEFISFQLQIPMSSNLFEHEITNFELTKEGDLYHVTLEMLAGFAQPSYNLEILFKDLVINRGGGVPD